jgi:hypothetical protein
MRIVLMELGFTLLAPQNFSLTFTISKYASRPINVAEVSVSE